MQLNPDLVNSLFSFIGSIFVIFNIKKLYNDKSVKGVFWASPLFFYTGQLWGVYFFYTLKQWYTFFGALLLVILSFIWYFMMIYYDYIKK